MGNELQKKYELARRASEEAADKAREASGEDIVEEWVDVAESWDEVAKALLMLRERERAEERREQVPEDERKSQGGPP